MNCCGNKRKEWLNEARPSRRPESIKDESPVLIADKPDRLFEYTGNYSLTIKGVASGKSYDSRFRGDKIKVDYSDAFAMMAERDLRILPK